MFPRSQLYAYANAVLRFFAADSEEGSAHIKNRLSPY
jgi:hypothetical protein